jgi:hypothetical protein
MRTVKRIIAIILILYSGYLLVNCIVVLPNITQYGKGMLTGSIIMLALGVIILIKTRKKKIT